MSLLSSISGPRDLDALSLDQLEQLAAEIRAFLIENVSRTGGHLGPNLGVVELTLAMHAVFDSPNDPIIFDTGHQSYVHKLLTGRQDFTGLRSRDGIAGYPQRSESAHDVVESSHASSSLSWADGVSRALTRTGRKDRHVIAVVGDGALTGGMTWEALNNISDDNDRNLVIIVNDNGRSYAPTIGGMARYLNRVRTADTYRNLRQSSDSFFRKLGPAARALYRGVRGGTHGFLSRFTNNAALYSNLDIKYLGPVDGHDLRSLMETLRLAKDFGAPVIVHAITEKGRGYPAGARRRGRSVPRGRSHRSGIGRARRADRARPRGPTSSQTSWSPWGRSAPRSSGSQPRCSGPTGLLPFAQRFPDRVYDVGIAEQHAVASAAGLAYGGLHPVVAIYATFMNRAFDQVMMDVALHRAGVTFVLDRAGRDRTRRPEPPRHLGSGDAPDRPEHPHRRTAGRRAAPGGAARGRRRRRRADRHPVPQGVGESRRCRRSSASPTASTCSCAPTPRTSSSSASDPMAHIAVEVADRLRAQGIGATVVDPRWACRCSRRSSSSRHPTAWSSRSRTASASAASAHEYARCCARPTSTPPSTSSACRTSSSTTRPASRSSRMPGSRPAKIAQDVVSQVLGTRIPVARPTERHPEWLTGVPTQHDEVRDA